MRHRSPHRSLPTAGPLARLLVAPLAGLLLVAGLATAPPAAAEPSAPPAPAARGAATQVRTQAAEQVGTQAAAPGTLEGTVTTPDGGTVDGLLELYVWRSSEAAFVRYDADITATGATSPFTFSRALPNGTYYPRFRPATEAYLPGYAGGATQPPTSATGPGTVVVSSTTGATATIALRVAPARRLVGGLVRDSTGAALEDVAVEAAQVDGEGYAETATDAAGRFGLRLGEGSWLLQLSDDQDRVVGTELSVTVAASDVTLPPTTLQRAGSATVTGRVLDAAGRPVVGAPAELHVLRDLDPARAGYEDSDWIAGRTTDAQGRFAVTGVVAGAAYTVAATAPGHVYTVLGGGSRVEKGTPVAVSEPGSTVAAPDLTLQASSRLTGLVTDTSGAPVPGVTVVLARWDAADQAFYDRLRTTTGPDGRYLVETLEAGDWAVRFEADPSSTTVDSAWLVGYTRPLAPGDPGTVSAGTPATLTRDRQLPRPAVVTGRVVDAAGSALTGVSVSSYAWADYGSSGAWIQGPDATTDGAGRFRVRAPRQTPVTVRLARAWSQTTFLGGGTTLPAAPGATTAVTTGDGTADTSAGDIVLPAKATSWGTRAGQRLDYCRDNSLPLTIDASSGAIDLPGTLPVRLADRSFSQLWVNTNGTVSFGARNSAYTPTALASATLPMVAAFWADWDPRANEVPATWGLSPDGGTFCAVWSDGGYFTNHADKLNTVQLLMRSAQGDAGRAPGDVDITLNYDSVLWESGDGSGGTKGRGGTAAVVGWTAGTGAPGSYVQQAGSLTPGALVNGGSKALVNGSLGSTQKGRYVYPVRNTVPAVAPGDLAGTVRDGRSGSALSGATVRLCPSGILTGCAETTTDTAGAWTFRSRTAGTYDVRVWGPGDALAGATTTATARDGRLTTLDPVVLAAPRPLPSGADLTRLGLTSAGVPRVDAAEPLALRVTGCPGVTSPTYSLATTAGTSVAGPLPLTPGTGGTYRADLAPLGGAGLRDIVLSTTVPASCGGAPVAFSVRAETVALVTDQWGRPLSGASVTLERGTSATGTFTAVPTGSTLLTPDARTNPSRTDASGAVRWEPVPGWYRLTAAATGCTPRTTTARELSDPRLDPVVALTCTATAPAPATAPSVTGDPRVGGRLSAADATWPNPLAGTGVVLLRNGAPLPSSSYTLGADDVDAVFTARSTARRATLTRSGEQTTFTTVTATSAPVTGATGAAPSAVVAPRAVGSGAVGTLLSLAVPTWDLDGVTNAPQWLRDGEPVAGATGATYAVTAADLGHLVSVRVTGTLPGRAAGSAISATVAPVEGAAPVATTAPRLEGPARVGTDLVAVPPTWDRAGVEVTATWLRDGSPLSGATGTTRRLVPADLGHDLAIRWSATQPGYATGQSTSTPVRVLEGSAPRASAIPNPTGSAEVGTDLVAVVPTWDLADTTSAPQWLRDGVAVPGATGPRYRLAVADLGHTLAVRWTGTLDGYAPGSATSAARTAVTGAAPRATTAPSLTAAPRVDDVLSVATGAWDAPDVTLSVQWLRDGESLAGATGTTYTPRPADAGRVLTARVTARRAGYRDGTAETTGATVLPGPAAVSLSTPLIAGEPVVGSTLNVSTGTWDRPDLDLAYQWLRDGQPMAGEVATGYVVRAEDAGHLLSARVLARRAGYADGVATSEARTARRGLGAVATTPPSVGGDPRVGEALVAAPGTWDGPAEIPPTLSYQWLRASGEGDLVAVEGATSTTYLPTAGELGDRIAVRVTASRPGNDDGAATSRAVVVGLGLAPSTPSAPTLDAVNGAVRVGSPVTAAPPAWDRAGVQTGEPRWLLDGEPLTGATGSTYLPGPDDLGHTLSATWEGTLPGHAAGAAATASTTIALGDGARATTAPALTGGSRVGETLTATTGAWDVEGLQVTHRWLRDGSLVAGATGSTYLLTADDAGHRVVAEVVASRTGYRDGVARTLGVDVARIRSTVRAQPLGRWKAGRPGALLVRVAAPLVDRVAGQVVVTERGRRLARTTLAPADDGTARVRLPRLDRGRHQLVVTYLGTDTVAPATDRLGVRVQRRR